MMFQSECNSVDTNPIWIEKYSTDLSQKIDNLKEMQNYRSPFHSKPTTFDVESFKLEENYDSHVASNLLIDVFTNIHGNAVVKC